MKIAFMSCFVSSWRGRGGGNWGRCPRAFIPFSPRSNDLSIPRVTVLLADHHLFSALSELPLPETRKMSTLKQMYQKLSFAEENVRVLRVLRESACVCVEREPSAKDRADAGSSSRQRGRSYNYGARSIYHRCGNR